MWTKLSRTISSEPWYQPKLNSAMTALATTILLCLIPSINASAQGGVYICTSKSAYAYHVNNGCSALNRCQYGVKLVSCADAIARGRTPCGKCSYDCAQAVEPESNEGRGDNVEVHREYESEAINENVNGDESGEGAPVANESYSVLVQAVDSLQSICRSQQSRLSACEQDYTALSNDFKQFRQMRAADDSLIVKRIVALERRPIESPKSLPSTLYSVALDGAVSVSPRLASNSISHYASELAIQLGVASRPGNVGWYQSSEGSSLNVGVVAEIVSLFEVSNGMFNNWVARVGGYMELRDRFLVSMSAPIRGSTTSEAIMEGVSGKLAYNFFTRPVAVGLFAGVTHERRNDNIIPQIGIRLTARGLSGS